MYGRTYVHAYRCDATHAFFPGLLAFSGDDIRTGKPVLCALSQAKQYQASRQLHATDSHEPAQVLRYVHNVVTSWVCTADSHEPAQILRYVHNVGTNRVCTYICT